MVDEVIGKRITLTPGARALVRPRRLTAPTPASLGGFTLFTAPIAAAIGFAENRGNRLDVDGDGRFTGRVLRRSSDARPSSRPSSNCGPHSAFKRARHVVGDGANDLLMISDGGTRRRLSCAANRRRSRRRTHRSLRSHGLLYAQGYAKSEISE